ncbi:hypothetical protein ABPG72_011195 [Tetrahymena utriculariae]
MSTFNIETLKEGDRKNFPQRGDYVKVHYTGTFLDGTKFDSSRDRGKPFEFTVGLQQVIRCWDEGILKLSKGQRAVLTCPYNYAYGERGISGAIPPKATLKFDVELIDFK